MFEACFAVPVFVIRLAVAIVASNSSSDRKSGASAIERLLREDRRRRDSDVHSLKAVPRSPGVTADGGNAKRPSLQRLGLLVYLIGRRPTLPHTRACSTIGAERLNYRVRDGNGWDPLAEITRNLLPGALALRHNPQAKPVSKFICFE